MRIPSEWSLSPGHLQPLVKSKSRSRLAHIEKEVPAFGLDAGRNDAAASIRAHLQRGHIEMMMRDGRMGVGPNIDEMVRPAKDGCSFTSHKD